MTDDVITGLTDLIYDAALAPEAWDRACEAMGPLVRGRAAILSQREESVTFVMPCSNQEQDIIDYHTRYWRTDMSMRRLRGAAIGASVVDSDIVSDDARNRLLFYSEYLQPRDLHRGCYTVIARDLRQSLVFSVYRQSKHDDFDQGYLNLVDHLRPHFGRAVTVAHRLRQAREMRHAASAALATAGIGLILTAANGAVRFANPFAESQLRGAGLRVRTGRLEALHAAANRELQAAIAMAARLSGGVSSQVSAPTGIEGADLRITVSPARPSDTMELSVEPLAMLVFACPGRAPAEERLRDAYSLTPAEARLLRALVTGERISEYAMRTGVRITTAKTHLASVFAKTGEQRQADLVRRALTDPALRFHLEA